jgi:hypothetical protein
MMQFVGWTMLTIFSLLLLYGVVAMTRRWMREAQKIAAYEWRWVPPPNYRCSRGKQGNCRDGNYW